MGYPEGPLRNRSVYEPDKYAVITPEGRVFNVIPGIHDCQLSILCSPKMGAQAVHIAGDVLPDGHTTLPYAKEEGVESFIFVIDGDGTLEVTVGDTVETLASGGYMYAPPGEGIGFKNANGKPLRIYLYKQRYVPHPDPAKKPWTVSGNVNAIEEQDYAEMANVHVRDLLPVDEAFDMNMHTLAFDPGGCHPFVETHVQEHGAYIYEGQGNYLLDETWLNVEKEDFIWFAPFTKQACYGTGLGRMTYIYSKDCHRDEKI